MYRYNTQKQPVAEKKYGRYIQEIIQRLASQEQPITEKHIKPLITAMGILTKTNQEQDKEHWHALYTLSGHTITIQNHTTPPKPQPTKDLKTKITYPQPQPNHRCCGKNLTAIIRKVIPTLSQQSEPKSIVQQLINLIGSNHPKKDLSALLHHIERVAGQKLPIPHQELATITLPKNPTTKNQKSRNHRYKRKQTPK